MVTYTLFGCGLVDDGMPPMDVLALELVND